MMRRDDFPSGLGVLALVGGAALGGLALALLDPQVRKAWHGRLRSLVQRLKPRTGTSRPDEETDAPMAFI
jgi:hypothetical protein